MKVGVVERRGQGLEWRGVDEEQRRESGERERREQRKKSGERESEGRRKEKNKLLFFFFPFHRAKLF